MTLTELYAKTLQKLHVVAAGESADPDDTDVVADKYVALHAMLLGKGLVTWSVTASVPAKVEIPVVSMLAYLCASEFDIDPNPLAPEGALDLPTPSLAERQLRRQLSTRYVSNPATSEYF